jgi:hypothetical protein
MRRTRTFAAVSASTVLLSLSGTGVAIASSLQHASTVSAATRGAVIYTGKTSQNKNFALARQGFVVKKAAWAWVARCASGKTLPLKSSTSNRPISSTGKWSASGSYNKALAGGFIAHVSGAIAGKFPSAAKVKGVFKMNAKIYKHGALVDKCTTGIQGFFAHD